MSRESRSLRWLILACSGSSGTIRIFDYSLGAPVHPFLRSERIGFNRPVPLTQAQVRGGVPMVSRAATLALAAAALIPLLAQSSSHREAPNITRFPKVDSTDLYLFMSYEPGREGYVTLL